MRSGRILLLWVVMAALTGGRAAAPVGQAQPARPNLLFVTIDTLRADRVGAYGHAGAKTPVLDRLAREGVLLQDAVVQVPQTRPSHASMLTGRYPYEHGLRDNASPRLKAGTPTLATVLRGLGYDTGAFIGAYPVSRPSGLDEGFATYDDPFAGGEGATSRQGAMERPAKEVVDAALAWLQQPRTAPFFAWIHLFDPHHPYLPPAAFRNPAQPYDGEVAYADSQLGRVVAWLDGAGLRGRTLVVVTSDHGEGLGDHGEQEHMLFVYDSTLHVPLLFSWPGRLPAGAKVAGQFRSIDLMATMLELLGAEAPPTSGASRASFLRPGGRLPDNESYAESLYGQLHFGYAPLRALRAEGWKYVDAPRPELYRLSEDPREARNLLDLRGSVAAAIKARLATYDREAGSAPAAAAAMDPEALERLAALGYVGGGFFHGGKPSGADPKDKIREFETDRRDTTRAIRLFREGDLDAALAILKRLARAVPLGGGQVLERRSFNVDFYLGRSLLAKGRPAEAIEPLRHAVTLSPTAAPAHAYLAEAYRAAGRTAEAEQTVDRALQVAPGNPELLAMKGRLLLQRGDGAAARSVLEKARGLDPRDARVRTDLASLYRNAGDLARARSEAQEAVRLDPRSPEAQVAWGLVLGAGGHEAEAAAAFRAALAEKPDHADALFYLGSVELRAGRADQALPLLTRLTARAPAYPGAQQALSLARANAGAAGGPKPGTVRLRLVRAKDRARIETAARRAAGGEDFAAVARALSEDPSASRGGDLGFVKPAELSAPLRAPAAALAPGQLSAVLETPAGFVILKRERE